ncbi:sodium/hydrogen exchanger 8 [Mayamaea pseudoterrestris]|nr:sodium/hydrogen exchanger 8 [Mayamaea pseudoterrestris]
MNAFRYLEDAHENNEGGDGYDDANNNDDDEYGSSLSPTWQTTEGISAYFVFFATLLAVVLLLSKFLHDRPRLGTILPEAGLTLLVGMAAGSVVHLLFISNEASAAEGDDDTYGAGAFAESLLSFSPNVLFVALLPPIIFNSGYHLRRELFFRHLLPISLFAVAGTLISSLSIAFVLDLVVSFGLTGDFKPTMTELLTFGALISTTDTVSILAVFQAKRVDPHLFYLVFGESALNDAVGLVLFKAFAKFVVPENGAGKIITSFGTFIFSFMLDAVGSPILGVLCGCLAALLFKYVDMRTNRLLELSLYILIMYVPFLLAELMHLSGIVTILFTGMTARSYVKPNLSPSTSTTAESLFRLAAYLAETSIFLELGLSVFGMKGSFNGKFTLWALFACLVARALNVYPIALFFNRALRRNPKGGPSCLPRSPKHGPPTKIATGLSFVRRTSQQQSSLQDDYYLEAEEMYHQPTTVPHAESDMSSMTPRKQRDLKIQPKTAHMLWFAGLRGAVAYACVRSFPDTFGHQNEFAMTTMAIVLVTVFVLGGTTGCVLNTLGVDVDVDEDKYMDDWHEQRQTDGSIRRLEAFIKYHTVRASEPQQNGATGASKIHSFESVIDGCFEQYSHQCGTSDYPRPKTGRSSDVSVEQLQGNLSYDDHLTIFRKESLFDFGGC